MLTRLPARVPKGRQGARWGTDMTPDCRGLEDERLSLSFRLSFYSGHSSFSMYCMLFVAVSQCMCGGGSRAPREAACAAAFRRVDPVSAKATDRCSQVFPSFTGRLLDGGPQGSRESPEAAERWLAAGPHPGPCFLDTDSFCDMPAGPRPETPGQATAAHPPWPGARLLRCAGGEQGWWACRQLLSLL